MLQNMKNGDSLSLHSSVFGSLIYYIEAGQYIIYSIAYAFTEQ